MYRIARVAAIAASAFVLSACASQPVSITTPSVATVSDESTEMAACAIGAAEVNGTCAWDAVSAEAILTPHTTKPIVKVTSKPVVTAAPKPVTPGPVTNRVPNAPTVTMGGPTVSKTIDPHVFDNAGTGVVTATPQGTVTAPDDGVYPVVGVVTPGPTVS